MRAKFRGVVLILLAVLAILICLARNSIASDEAAAAFISEPKRRSGWFLSLAGGYNEREDADDELARAMFAPGYLAALAIGYRFENLPDQILKNLRIELEYSRQFNEIEQLHLHPPDPPIDRIEDAQGRIDIESVQGNFYYDLPLKQFFSLKSTNWLTRITPYLGVGLGFGRSVLKDLSSNTLETYVEGYPLSTTTDWVFVYTPRFGITCEINREFDLFIAGRLYKSEKVTVNAAGEYTHPNVETWAAELGFRYNF